MRLDGKVALISGAAQGIGAACARLFATEGACVAVGDILETEGRQVVKELVDGGAEALFLPLDVTSESQWKQAVSSTVERFRRLDILVNNAGVSAGTMMVEDTSPEEWDRVMDVNAKGVFLGTRTAIPVMRKTGGGSIVNMSSQLGLVGTDNSSTQYHASKGAVRLFTKSAAIHYASEGIRVNSVHPGPIVTPMTDRGRADKKKYALTLSRMPLGRYGEADEVAYGVLYLASDEASYVTGSEVVVDGGWTAQ
ncbi:MAG: SDR family oxidoreductase [SAR202 cluster bacterium]|jgi:NAD(P)-dependent dehydrogenase (short-subunit alcohol dehydrogenase family)|nr:SDR family oxidoreductase [SAR202 cluster bacterium]